MPNSSSRSIIFSLAAWLNSGLNSTPNSEHAPVKSRFHSAWPGAPGKPGCSTCATSGRWRSQWATNMPLSICSFSRTPMLRRPRKVSQQSSGLAYWPSALAVRRTISQSASEFVVMLPSSRSECPPAYLVSAWMDTSTPCWNGWK